MQGYTDNIEKLTLENTYFRRVLYTAKFSQLVLMSLRPQEEIGEEVHDVDQFFRFEKGKGIVVIDKVKHDISAGSAVIVPAGAKHNVINSSATDSLKLYTLYCPPHHRDGVTHETKDQAQADDEHFAGHTSES
jgi:mannose-6-phosphate isomerase-like protein (cupin superfamily)